MEESRTHWIIILLTQRNNWNREKVCLIWNHYFWICSSRSVHCLFLFCIVFVNNKYSIIWVWVFMYYLSIEEKCNNFSPDPPCPGHGKNHRQLSNKTESVYQTKQPWLVWLSWSCHVPLSERSLVWSLVRAYAWVQVCPWSGCVQEATHQCFSPSLSPSLPL